MATLDASTVGTTEGLPLFESQLTSEMISSWSDQVAETEVRRVEEILDRGVGDGRGEDYREALDEIRCRFRRLTVTQRERVVEMIGDPS